MIAVPLVDRSSFHSFRDDRNRETAWCIDHVSSTKPRLIVGFAEVAAVRRVLRVFAAALGGCGRLGLLDRLAPSARRIEARRFHDWNTRRRDDSQR
jgi:hypothetical protein